MTTTRTPTAAKNRLADRELVRACLDGDVRAWETLILRHRRLIYSIPIRLGLDRTDADEIFQQVAVKLFEKLGDLRDAATLPAWLAVTTRRECYASLERNKRWVTPDETAPEPIADNEDVETGLHQVACEHTLGLALDQLDSGCRDLLVALYYEEPTPSYQELSARLDRPVGSLGPTRNRCLKKLRRFYEDVGGPEY